MDEDAPVDYIARTTAQYASLGYEPYAWARRPAVNS